jgi:hypothetical protein
MQSFCLSKRVAGGDLAQTEEKIVCGWRQRRRSDHCKKEKAICWKKETESRLREDVTDGWGDG